MSQSQVNKAKNKELFDKIKADYENVFGSAEGRRVLKDMKLSAHFSRSTYNEDIYKFAMNEGQRLFVLHVEHMATPQPEAAAQEKAKT